MELLCRSCLVAFKQDDEAIVVTDSLRRGVDHGANMEFVHKRCYPIFYTCMELAYPGRYIPPDVVLNSDDYYIHGGTEAFQKHWNHYVASLH